MDEHEPKEQFEATDYDENGNIKLPPPPLEAAKPKRPTVAGLKKDLEDMESYIENEVLEWLGELATRLEALEKSIPILQHNQSELMKVFKVVQSDVEALPTTTENSDTTARLDDQDAAIDALATALRSHLADVAVMKSKPEPELEFAQPPKQTVDRQARAGDIGSLRQTYPPVQTAGETADISAIAAIASVCQHMTDVILICRALNEIPELTDEERNGILNTACRSSGVIITPGLQIRAGVKFAGA